MKVGERQQQGRGGAKPKTICPKCGKEYLETAGGKKGKSWKRIGQYCPNPSWTILSKILCNWKTQKRRYK